MSRLSSLCAATTLALVLLRAMSCGAENTNASTVAPVVNSAEAVTPAEFNNAIGAMTQKLDAIDNKLAEQANPQQTHDEKAVQSSGTGGASGQPATAQTTAKPGNDPDGRTPLDTLILLFVAGLMGMVGQGARTIVGLKQVSDRSDTVPSQADEFDAARILVGLMIGFVAGVAAIVMSNTLFGVEQITPGFLLSLAAVGYIGVDAIEGLTNTIGGSKLLPKPTGESLQKRAIKQLPVKTTLKQNQIDAYHACIDSGLSPEAGIAFTANVTRESLSKPDDVSRDPSAANPNNKAHGIVQWDDDRAQRIKQHFGLFPEDMPVTQQTKAALWEIESFFDKVWDVMKTSNEPKDIVEILVYDYELPKDKAGEMVRRQALIPEIEKVVGAQSA